MEWQNFRSLPEARPRIINRIAIIPSRGAQAIRWNFLNRETVFPGGPIRNWPECMARLAIQDHLNNEERQRLNWTMNGTYFWFLKTFF